MFGLDNLMDLLFESAMESISRNERVIQLLKRLNLDPDHPPADFTGVYQYALVEYGVGKPRPVLEIFRQAKIQELFREALDRNNPSILLKNGEDFLADSPLQADLQASNVDVRREFYSFAAVFIEVAKRTRTPAEILAEQKLESLHRQIGSLQERLNRLPTIEGMRTEMARLAAQEYPALPGSESFSAEQCKAFALAQQMRGWFETLGFRFESHEVWQDDYFEWIINIPVRRGRYDRILVRGIDGEAGLSDVEDLKQSAETHRTDEGWLVTARRISRAARNEVEKAENEGLGCYTLDELLDQDADFSGYLTWLETEIQKRGIDQKYVPLACFKEEIDADTQQRIGVSRYDDRDGWIDGYIDLWLDDPAKEHISVLGEFGTGKTWFALHYAWKALQRYREAQRRGLERPRLPLVIPLRDYAKAVSVESLFSEFFFRKHEIPIPGYSAFEQLNRMGKLLLIFDGFDEMAARVDRQEMINNFWELAKVVVPGAKVILTCRTEHFPEAKEGRALLNAELQASTRDLTGETPQFEVLELEKFNDEQIRQVLEHQAQPATVEQIMGNPQLLDLARRPVLTELILEALPDIEAGKPVDMSRVYLYAVRHKMERDIKAERTFTSMADKLYFMCELSWEMLSTDRMSINYREFPDRIRKLFGPVVQEERELDHWHYDMMGQTMLIRNAEGDYAPAHRSLLEFFVAYKFAAELGALESDFLGTLKTGENLNFNLDSKNYVWSEYLKDKENSKSTATHKSPINHFTTEKLEILRLSFGRTPLEKAVQDLLVPMLIRRPPETHPLMGVIHATRHKDEQDTGYVGGNAATLLIRQNINILSGQDLSHTVLKQSDFESANLQNTSFFGANLEKSSFLQSFGDMRSIEFSPNGNLLATCDPSGEIQIWKVVDRKMLWKTKAHTGSVWSVSFSPDGRILASGGRDRTIKLWDIERPKADPKKLVGHSDEISNLSFSPDGKLLASASLDRTIKFWDSVTGKCIATLTGHENRVSSITFHPEGQILASGSTDSTIKFWNVKIGKCLTTLKGHSGWVSSVAFSRDGKLLASGSGDQTIRLWDVSSGEFLRSINAHSGWVRSVAFNPVDETLASCSNDRTIKLWDIQNDQCIRTLKGHLNRIFVVRFSPDGKLLASGGGDQTIRFWNHQTGECIQVLQGYLSWLESSDFSLDGQLIATGGTDHKIRIWNFKENQPVHVFQGHTAPVHSVAFESSGKLLVSGSYSEEAIRIWDIKTGSCLKVISENCNKVNQVIFGLNKDHLISSEDNDTVKIWDAQTGNCHQILKSGCGEDAVPIVFIPKDNILACGYDDANIRLWKLSNGTCQQVLSGHTAAITSLTINKIDHSLISGSADGTLRIWDISSGSCVRTLGKHLSSIWAVAVSPDGQTIASGSMHSTIRLWSTKGELIRTFKNHFGGILSISFSPDGTCLMSIAEDNTIRLWDAQTTSCLSTLKAEKPYENMNITDVKGLSQVEKDALKALGAFEN